MIIISQPIQNKYRLVENLISLVKFDARQWPISSACLLPKLLAARDMLSEVWLLKLSNSHTRQLADTFFHQHGLIGHCTCVVTRWRKERMVFGGGTHCQIQLGIRTNSFLSKTRLKTYAIISRIFRCKFHV
jgi:hypothetical protein